MQVVLESPGALVQGMPAKANTSLLIWKNSGRSPVWSRARNMRRSRRSNTCETGGDHAQTTDVPASEMSRPFTLRITAGVDYHFTTPIAVRPADGRLRGHPRENRLMN